MSLEEKDRIFSFTNGELPENGLIIVFTTLPVKKTKIKKVDTYFSEEIVSKFDNSFLGTNNCSEVLKKVKDVMSIISQSNIDDIIESNVTEDERIWAFQQIENKLPKWLFHEDINEKLPENVGVWDPLGWIEDMYSETRGWTWWSSVEKSEGWSICLRVNCMPYQVELFRYLLYAAGARNVSFIDCDGKVY